MAPPCLSGTCLQSCRTHFLLSKDLCFCWATHVVPRRGSGGGNKVVPLLAKGQIYVLVQSPAKPALTAVLARGCILACRCTVAVTSLTTGRGTKAHPCSQVLCSQEPHPLLTQKHAACGSGPSSHAVASCVCGARRSELETTAHNVQAAGHHQNGTRPHSHARILNGWEHSNQGNSEPEQR